MEITIPDRFLALSHPNRLAVFRLLMRRYPDQVAASELARALGFKANTLSTYVNALRAAGLITQTREGTSLRYAADIRAMRETVGYLTHDCCQGRADICDPVATDDAVQMGQETRKRVLFLCTGNSARSLLAEAILAELGGARFSVYSAGTDPQAHANPLAIETLTARGHRAHAFVPKDLARFQAAETPPFHFVLSLCDKAANEDRPAWAGAPVCAHWGMPDPAADAGAPDAIRTAFASAYDLLRLRLEAFAALPLATLDRISLQRALDDIGRLTHRTPA